MKPEPVYGRDDIRYCHYCAHWDGNVYTLDAYGRKRLIRFCSSVLSSEVVEISLSEED